MRRADLTGRRFGKLTALNFAAKSASGKPRWLCRCDCGAETLIQTSNLTSGHTSSCGCQQMVGAHSVKGAMTHGMTKSPTFGSWSSMRERCLNPSCKEYKHYGGRGITICARWSKFENFHADMGDRPAGHTIDRIKVNEPYEPGNCRWATPKQQARNKRNNRLIDGVTLIELSEKTGIKRTTLARRLNHGQPVEGVRLKARIPTEQLELHA